MPTFMVWARIVAKRENYYVTFEDANHKRREFQVNSRDYAQFEVGDTGGLSYDELGFYRGFALGEMPGRWEMPD
jgi:hypothetical protein